MKSSELENELFKNPYELKYEGEKLVTSIVDVYLDRLQLSFHNDGCVEINTEGKKAISLSLNHLLNLIKLIDTAKQIDDIKLNNLFSEK
jgi:hypothetical protein